MLNLVIQLLNSSWHDFDCQGNQHKMILTKYSKVDRTTAVFSHKRLCPTENKWLSHSRCRMQDAQQENDCISWKMAAQRSFYTPQLSESIVQSARQSISKIISRGANKRANKTFFFLSCRHSRQVSHHVEVVCSKLFVQSLVLGVPCGFDVLGRSH